MTLPQLKGLKDFMEEWFQGTYKTGDGKIELKDAQTTKLFVKEISQEDLSFDFAVKDNLVTFETDFPADREYISLWFDLEKERGMVKRREKLGSVSFNFEGLNFLGIIKETETAMGRFPATAFLQKDDEKADIWDVLMDRHTEETDEETIKRLIGVCEKERDHKRKIQDAIALLEASSTK